MIISQSTACLLNVTEPKVCIMNELITHISAGMQMRRSLF